MFGINAMKALGFFVFTLKTVPYQSMSRDLSFRQTSNNVIGELPKTQFVGKEAEKVELSGVLMPEVSGGTMSLAMLEQMAESGKAFPLISGANFTVEGWFVIENIKETYSEFFADGTARKIEFSLSLKRTDESMLKELLGDTIGSASDFMAGGLDKVGQVVSGGLNSAMRDVGKVVGGFMDEATGIMGNTIEEVSSQVNDFIGGWRD